MLPKRFWNRPRKNSKDISTISIFGALSWRTCMKGSAMDRRRRNKWRRELAKTRWPLWRLSKSRGMPTLPVSVLKTRMYVQCDTHSFAGKLFPEPRKKRFTIQDDPYKLVWFWTWIKNISTAFMLFRKFLLTRYVQLSNTFSKNLIEVSYSTKSTAFETCTTWESRVFAKLADILLTGG